MMIALLILKVFLISWVITKYDPWFWFLDSISPYFTKNHFTKLIYNSIVLATSCLKCCSLYVGLIMGGLFIGVASSFVAYLYMQLLAPKIDKIYLQ